MENFYEPSTRDLLCQAFGALKALSPSDNEALRDLLDCIADHLKENENDHSHNRGETHPTT